MCGPSASQKRAVAPSDCSCTRRTTFLAAGARSNRTFGLDGGWGLQSNRDRFDEGKEDVNDTYGRPAKEEETPRRGQQRRFRADGAQTTPRAKAREERGANAALIKEMPPLTCGCTKPQPRPCPEWTSLGHELVCCGCSLGHDLVCRGHSLGHNLVHHGCSLSHDHTVWLTMF